MSSTARPPRDHSILNGHSTRPLNQVASDAVGRLDRAFQGAELVPQKSGRKKGWARPDHAANSYKLERNPSIQRKGPFYADLYPRSVADFGSMILASHQDATAAHVHGAAHAGEAPGE